MRFYLVDRITDIAPRERIAAFKLASGLDPVVEPHPLYGHCLTPPLVIESLAQTGAWLVLISTDFAQRGVLGSFRNVIVGRPAPLGERLDLVATVDSWTREAVMFQWEASCRGESVVRVENALCLLIDAGILEDPAETRQLHQALHLEALAEEAAAAWSEGDVLVPPPPQSRWVPYDARQHSLDGRATAVKSISMTDPVFTTHFPRFPTVPGVLLMQSLLSLGRETLQAQSPGTAWRIASMQGVRFQRYVRPGDRLLLQTRVDKATEAEAIVTGEALVGAQRAMTIRQMRFVPNAAGR